jgi:adenosylcobinamide hydrolase
MVSPQAQVTGTRPKSATPTEDSMLQQTRYRDEDGRTLPVLVWHWPAPVLAIASGPLGGGLGLRHWVVNAQVRSTYSRQNSDQHLASIAAELRLDGPGVGMLTAADVEAVQSASEAGVTAAATVGLGVTTLAALPEQCAGQPDRGIAGPAAPGTINIVALMPRRLTEAALVNAVITVTEAKTQAVMDAGVRATGTATDAVSVVCPADGHAEPFGGPRSTLGAPLARVVHQTVRAGAAAWLAGAGR